MLFKIFWGVSYVQKYLMRNEFSVLLLDAVNEVIECNFNQR